MAVMGTYQFRRLFGKHLTGVYIKHTCLTPRARRKTVRSYAITVPLGSPTAADRLADPRPRARPDAQGRDGAPQAGSDGSI